MAGNSKSKISSVQMYVKWNPSAGPNIMLNTDSSWDPASRLSTLGGVFRNSVGDWILGFTGTCPSCQPLEMETQALLLGLTLALHYGLMHLEINVDSQKLVHLLNSLLYHDSPLFTDYRYLLHRMGDPSVSHVYREQNKLADALAAAAITTNFADNNTMLFWNPPASLMDILQADKNGELYNRRVTATTHSNMSMFNTSSARQVVHTPSASSLRTVVAEPQLMPL